MVDVVMKIRGKIRGVRDRLLLQEDLNFLLTNRVPRIALTRFMGWFSKRREAPVRWLSMAIWRACTELDLRDAKKTRFDSLHDCFIRELKPGARTIDTDPAVLSSPCDAIVGACGTVHGTQVFQAKGYPYDTGELFGPASNEPYRGGTYVTLRLTSSMYHRFHAPHDARVEQVDYLSGDAWNVNPIALARVERLFCRNERAVIRLRLDRGGHRIALVPVAAILVASIRLHCADVVRNLRDLGPHRWQCDAQIQKGQELGWFEHGSTIIVFAPPGFTLAAGVAAGTHIRMGQALMCLPASP